MTTQTRTNMRTLKSLTLFLSVMTISIIGCKKEKQKPTSGGGGGSNETENCCICTENGTEIICDGDFDMEGESWDYWVDFLETNGCDCEENSAGFNCETGNCIGATSNAEYASMTECQNMCSVSSDTYNCVDGNCNNVGSGGAYASFSDCQAQCGGGDYLLNKDFSDNSLTSGGWTQYIVSSSPQQHQWEIGNFSGTNPYAVANAFDNPGSSDTELWLISPPINLTNTNQPIFSFRNASRYQGNALQILVSVNYDGSSNPAQQGEWLDQTSIFVWDTNPNAFSWTNSGEVDFSPLNGTNNVRIAFKYTSTTNAAATWELDDIIMEEQGTTTTGYNCENGNCQSVSSGAQYGTLAECQAACGGSSNNCCDCTGIGFTCDECCDGEFDMLGESWATWLQIFESSGCNCE